MNIELHNRILKLKSILNKINDTSYAYSQISKRFPYQNAKTDEELQKIINIYKQLILDLFIFLENSGYGKQKTTT